MDRRALYALTPRGIMVWALRVVVSFESSERRPVQLCGRGGSCHPVGGGAGIPTARNDTECERRWPKTPERLGL